MNAQALAEVRTLVEQGETVNNATKKVGEQYQVAPSTLRLWAKQQGKPLGDAAQDAAKKAREVAAEQYRARRAKIRLMLLDAAEDALTRFKGSEGRDAQALAVAAGIFIDKMRLEEGEATARSESISLQEIDRQIRLLEAELDGAGHH